MRYSQLFIPTFKEAPADAQVPSHKLLVRADSSGSSVGIYSYFPLAKRSLTRSAIIREKWRHRGAGVLLRRSAPRDLEGVGALGRHGRQHVPPEGPQGARTTASA